ncbi:MAG: phosphoglycerate kinase [Candidatus Magasanikbacteria bacterium]|nr:phosphoglycerate kinase [Candidatus Magasanikbacteria bacterium]
MKISTLAEKKNLKGRRVLVRVDFNVPLKNGKIKEAYKIEKSLSTVEFLCKAGAKIILISHLGRPTGVDKKLSLKPVAVALGKMLEKKIDFFAVSDKILGDKKQLENLQKKIMALKNGDVALLENIRFIKGEEKNDPKIARALSSLGELFVLDGFAVAHRDAASVSGVAKYLPACAGLLLEEEIKGLAKLIERPKKPFVVVLGGAKMETKVPLIKKFIPKASQILIGGGIFNTCLWAKGVKVGRSIVDKNYKKIALSFWKNKKIIMPVDLVVGGEQGEQAKVVALDSKFKIQNLKNGIYDIGPKTVSLFAKYIKKANTLVWNGSMGMFEVPPYHWGSNAVARLFASRARGKAFGVTGGGETVEVVKKLKLMNDIDLVSTGGGAMLEYLSGNKLPGIMVVLKK